MLAGRAFDIAHQPSSTATTRPSASTRERMRWPRGSAAPASVATGRAASAGPIVPLQTALDRLEQEPIGAIDEEDDEHDDDEEDRRAVVLAREIEEIAEARSAADELGRERHFPRDAEADAQGREHERVERGDDDADEA